MSEQYDLPVAILTSRAGLRAKIQKILEEFSGCLMQSLIFSTIVFKSVGTSAENRTD